MRVANRRSILRGDMRPVARLLRPANNIKFIDYEKTAEYFAGKSVAVIGSGPGCLDNDGQFIESHDLIVRINNYKLRTKDGAHDYTDRVGRRTDVCYSFFGGSIKKSQEELIQEGVRLLMCKCPDARLPDEALKDGGQWHRKHGKERGRDFRWINRARDGFWFCDTYVPTLERFISYMRLLNGHIPTTGFSCILDILSFDCASVYITGFDFFRSGIHNVNEGWRRLNHDDPIQHVPEKELELLRTVKKTNITYDRRLHAMIHKVKGKWA